MFLLDTSIVSLLHAGNEKIRDRLQAIDPERVAISIVTKIEILRARFEFVMKAATAAELLQAQFWLQFSESELKAMNTLTVNEKVAMRFDQIRTLKGIRKIGRADVLIACFARAYDATLVTRNTKDFARIPQLKLENWPDD